LIEKTKTIQYKTLIRPVLLHALETRCLTQQQDRVFSASERKVVRKIIGAVEDEVWQIWFNRDFHELFTEPNNMVMGSTCDLYEWQWNGQDMWSVRVTVKWAGHVICTSDSEMGRTCDLYEWQWNGQDMWSVWVTVKWAGHVICMSDSEMGRTCDLYEWQWNAPKKRVMNFNPEGKRRVGRTGGYKLK